MMHHMRDNRRDLTIAFVAAAALALTACGGDSSSSDASSTNATSPAAVESTVADTVPETTEVEQFVTFTADELIAALPTIADLGEGWIDAGGTAIVNPEPKEGPGYGTCGGPNAAARATNNAVTNFVFGANAIGPNERRASTSLYVFADAESAQGFLDDSAAATQCPDGITWEWIQKANPVADNEFNGFGPGFEDITENQVWRFNETATAQYGETEDVLEIAVDRSRELTAAGITFRQTDTTFNHYDRYENIVIVTIVAGTWGLEGYINLDQVANFQPTLSDLSEYTTLVQPVVLERLGWQPA